jgi:RNA polymerase sigma factor (sigma-70 family)
MIHRKNQPVGGQVGDTCTAESLSGLSDSHLLGRFQCVQGDKRELAFRELVQRHGPMVMGVCRQVLRHPHDAEDAFQATFLVLVQKAGLIEVAGSLGPWLHSVAYRTAQRARTISARYRQDDRNEIEAIATTHQDTDQREMRRLMQEELARLPDKYQAPIVLCHVEGKTHEEAARLLHWPVGTVSGRLSRGRELLKARLERRGFAVPSAIMTAPWLDPISISSIESALGAMTPFAAAQSVSASVISLTRGVIKTMFLNRLKTISLAVLAAGFVTGAVWAHMPTSSRNRPAQSDVAASTTPNAVAPFDAGIHPSEHVAVQTRADNQLERAEDPPFECPLVMAGNAVTRAMGYFQDHRAAPAK